MGARNFAYFIGIFSMNFYVYCEICNLFLTDSCEKINSMMSKFERQLVVILEIMIYITRDRKMD